ncbi:PHP domain-containing protein [Acrocarpospora sp. B8E8]|uniref:PHP domain-containing protein n=1 Tax=Acrocarpospora sp. B8E8 TaxID=3153572 RepID=UPI00325CAD36
MMPPDGHVHIEWSWDTVTGSMEASCRKAIELGLPSIAFTEHADLTRWTIPAGTAGILPEHIRPWLRPDGTLQAPDLDVAGYLEAVRRCRDLFPALRIVSGVELSEPHRHPGRVDALLAAGHFDRVLGSVHALEGGLPVDVLFDARPQEEIHREYLAEVLTLVESASPFTVLAHIDYPIRYWSGHYRPSLFEAELREVLGALASSGRVLEVNTRVPLHPRVVGWWREAGGSAVSFGSDAHAPMAVGHGFSQAAAMVEAQGFRPDRDPHAVWTRRST